MTVQYITVCTLILGNVLIINGCGRQEKEGTGPGRETTGVAASQASGSLGRPPERLWGTYASAIRLVMFWVKVTGICNQT